MSVGLADTEHRPGRREQQLVASQPVPDRDQQEEGRAQTGQPASAPRHRDLGGSPRRRPVTLWKASQDRPRAPTTAP